MNIESSSTICHFGPQVLHMMWKVTNTMQFGFLIFRFLCPQMFHLSPILAFIFHMGNNSFK